MAARAAERAARAGLSSLDAEEKVTEGAVNSAEQLAGTNAVANPAFRQAFETAHGQALVAARTRGQIEASLSEAVAAEYRAKTELDAAKLQKAETQVMAPAAGTVADIQTNVGAMVQPGVTLMTIIGEAQPVVTANFKETQIGRMRAGQPATIRIDALAGRSFTGHVEFDRAGLRLAVRAVAVRAGRRQLHQDRAARAGTDRARSRSSRPRPSSRRPFRRGDGAARPLTPTR